jgi:hypothetical protein
MPYHIDRLEIPTGRSTPWDGRYFQDLYLVEGLRP